MKIREYLPEDQRELDRIHKANGLPGVCLLDGGDPLVVVGQVVEIEGKLAVAAFVRLTGEAYLFVDHRAGTHEERWHAVKCLAETVEVSAKLKGLTEFTAWIPPDLVKSFGKRLEQLGWIKSPWVSFTKVL